MDYYRRNSMYAITRITESKDNILGISFAETNSSENNIEVVELSFSKYDNSIIRTSKKEVLTQVLSGLNAINELFGTDYKVSKIAYVPSEDGSNSTYQFLTRSLLKHYHNGNEFRDK